MKTHSSLKPTWNLPGFRKSVEFKEMDNSVESTDKELPFCYKEVRQR
jgi:hypothetical protein